MIQNNITYRVIPNSMNQTTELKLVKKAHLETNGIVSQIRHYDTIIFLYNQDTKIASCLMNCSVTSNKQIKYAIEFFRPEKVNEKLNEDKWGFSGDRTN